jgi:hypothetical protein
LGNKHTHTHTTNVTPRSRYSQPGRALNHGSHGATDLGFCRPVDTPDGPLCDTAAGGVEAAVLARLHHVALPLWAVSSRLRSCAAAVKAAGVAAVVAAGGAFRGGLFVWVKRPAFWLRGYSGETPTPNTRPHLTPNPVNFFTPPSQLRPFAPYKGGRAECERVRGSQRQQLLLFGAVCYGFGRGIGVSLILPARASNKRTAQLLLDGACAFPSLGAL